MVRRFPRPWVIEETTACYFVRDADGKKFAYCYYLDREPLSHDGDKLTKDEALLIARNILKLAE